MLIMTKNIQVYTGQSLVDIAIQEYGSISGLTLILEDNKDTLTAITDIAPGLTLKVRTPIPALDVTNRQVVKYFQENYNPATWQLE